MTTATTARKGTSNIIHTVHDQVLSAETHQRSLHLVDVENLCGTGRPDGPLVELTLRRYRRVMGVRACDQVVLGASGKTAFLAGSAWPGVQLAVGYGPDGADRALLSRIDVPHIVGRFGRVVVASGDHAFAPVILQLLDAELRVTVVAATGSLSGCLRASGAEIRHFMVEGPRATDGNSHDMTLSPVKSVFALSDYTKPFAVPSLARSSL